MNRDFTMIRKGLHEAECLLEDRVPARFRGKALQAVRDAMELCRYHEEMRTEMEACTSTTTEAR